MQRTQLESTWDAPGHGEQPMLLVVEHYTPKDRAVRALQWLAGCWLLAGLTFFIPVFHFFLVPGFLLLGLGLGLRNWLVREAAVAARGISPVSGDAVEVNLGNAKPSYPLWTFCPDSGERLRIARPQSPAAA